MDEKLSVRFIRITVGMNALLLEPAPLDREFSVEECGIRVHIYQDENGMYWMDRDVDGKQVLHWAFNRNSELSFEEFEEPIQRQNTPGSNLMVRLYCQLYQPDNRTLLTPLREAVSVLENLSLEVFV